MSPRQALQIEYKTISDLLLDGDNPRLTAFGESKTQEDLTKVLWDEMAVSEVALSIAANGYFKEEPLFIVPGDPSKNEEAGRFIVVEGNRRLAAVKLLCDPALRRMIRATDLPKLSEKEIDNLSALPVSIYPNKKSLWEFFGFRHVNGPKEWDSFSKASYIASVRRNYQISLREIARRIGDQHSTVERIYRGYVLLEQAEKSTTFDREDRIANRFYFSHLYTAADQREFQLFLGIDPERSLKEAPVPKANLPQLKELMVWLFGSKSENKAPVVEKQNPHLNYLRQILGKKEALYALRSGISIKRAFEISLGDSRRFQEALVRAKDSLHEAKATVTTGYKGERDLVSLVDDIMEIAKSIAEEMRRKAKV